MSDEENLPFDDAPARQKPVNQENSPAGPFDVEPVDAIVFAKSNDAPETRAAATLLEAIPEFEREAAPEAPKQENHSSWTPKPENTELPQPQLYKQSEEYHSKKTEKVYFPAVGKLIIYFLIVAVPLALLAGAVLWGMKLVGAF